MVFHRTLLLGPLLFLIYINDLPQECKTVNVNCSAADTHLTAAGTLNAEIESDHKRPSYWLNANKLVLNNKEKLYK